MRHSEEESVMPTDDLDIDEQMDALERQIDGLFDDEPEHKDRFVAAIANYLMALPAAALLSDIPAQHILGMYRRTGN
jgi:hypothetical protein